MKRFIAILFLFQISLSCFAGGNDDVNYFIKKGNSYFYQEDYKAAQFYYHNIDANHLVKIQELVYNLGVCYLYTGFDYKKAIEYIKSSEEYAYELGVEEDYFYYLGMANHLNYSFIEAVNNFHKFIDLASLRDERVDDVNRRIMQCKNAELIMKNPVDVKIVNIGANINSKYSDYTPVISSDESVLLFTSRREGSTGGLLNENGKPDSVSGRYFEDIYASIKFNGEWKRPVSVGSSINTEGHDAVAGISPTGQEMYVYRSDSSLYGNLFMSEHVDYQWTRLSKLPNPINTKFWEGSISVSKDGRSVYFASNRPDGYGGKDIYVVNKLPDDSWAQAKNMGPNVNTPFDEDAPFFHEESSTLYFSSQGHYNMGGFDIFKSTLNGSNEWKPAENIGYPINTTGDDISFVLSGDGKRGYYAAKRNDSYGEQDIYVINFGNVAFEDPDKGPVTILKGVVSTCDNNENVNSTVKLFEYESNELLGVYKPNPITGNFVIAIPQGKRYQMQVEAPGYDVMSRVISKAYNEMHSEVNEKIILCSVDDDKKIVNKKTIIVAVNDTIELLDSPAIIVDILKNDIYPYNAELFSKITTKARGRITFDNAGRIRYFPIPFYRKIDSFKYEIQLNDYVKSNATVYLDYRNIVVNQTIKHTLKDSLSYTMFMDIKSNYDTVLFDGVRFKIQIGAFSKKLSKKSSLLRSVPKTKVEKTKTGLFKYLVGNYKTMNKAVKSLVKIRRNGVKDAFLVIYKDGERISIKMLHKIAFGFDY